MTMRKEIGEPVKEKAINQLEILARRGYFSIPAYDFEEDTIIMEIQFGNANA